MAAGVAVSVTTSATTLIAANPKRISLFVQNLHTVSIFFSETSGVTTANGLELKPNEMIVEEYDGHETRYTGAYFGIVASGTADVRVWERTLI